MLAAGLTNAFGSGTQIQANVPGSFPDGAAPDSFWDIPLVDFPGVSVTGVHCHGSVKFELQVGATGPSHDNPCYAAMGVYTGNPSEWDVYITLPGNRAVYRISQDDQPWRYCIGGLLFDAPFPTTGAPSPPC